MKVSAIVASLALASYVAAVALKPEWKNEKRDDTDSDTEVYADWIKKRDEAPLPEQTLEELVKDDVLKVGVLTQPIAANPDQQPTIEIQSEFLGVAVPVADGASLGSNVPNPVIPGKLKPAVPIPDTKISAAAPNLVTDDNFNITPYLTDCQFNLMLQITSFMEDSTQDYYGKFGFCKASSNNQGISAGFLEFTTCSGSLLQVCKKYNSLKPSNFCSKYLTIDGAGKTTGPLIDATKDKRCRTPSGKESYIPRGLEPFCSDWTTSSKDQHFILAQLMVIKNAYFDSTAKVFTKYNVQAPLTKSEAFDILIQLGPGALSQIAINATKTAGGSPASNPPVPEVRWLQALLNSRRWFLQALGGVYSQTVYRVDAVQGLLDRKKYSDQQVSDNMSFKGNSATLTFSGGMVKTFDCSVPNL